MSPREFWQNLRSGERVILYIAFTMADNRKGKTKWTKTSSIILKRVSSISDGEDTATEIFDFITLNFYRREPTVNDMLSAILEFSTMESEEQEAYLNKD